LLTVISAGQVMVGSSLSITVTSKLQVAVFPLPSVTTKVLVVVPTGNALPLGNPAVWVRVAPGQLSAVVGVAKVTTAEHNPVSLFTVISAGQLIVGFSVSLTVTVNVQVAVLPEASVAVAVTVVIPTGKDEPEAGEYDIVAPGQLSVTDPAKFTIALHCPGALLAVISAGQVTAGASVSLTVTLNVHEAVFPAASVAVAVTKVVPTGNVDPEGGVTTSVTPGLSSVAVTVKFTTASQTPESVPTVISEGQVTTGGVTSDM
jgi:hypothetical protein